MAGCSGLFPVSHLCDYLNSEHLGPVSFLRLDYIIAFQEGQAGAGGAQEAKLPPPWKDTCSRLPAPASAAALKP